MKSNNPVILAIETATAACSVALLCDGRVSGRFEVGNNIHSEVLLEMVKELLSDAGISAKELDAVAVGQGPGSFTGLRIGVGAAQGIAFGVNAPMIGVSSLDVLANSAIRADQISVIAGIDARMGEIYWAEYEVLGNILHRNGNIQVSSPAEIVSSNTEYLLVGNAWGEYWDQLTASLRSGGAHIDDIFYPDAKSLLELAELKYQRHDTVSAIDFKPIYIRNDVAKKSSKPLPGRRV